jgi:AbrB family looped-hinge helix DNA binding protein
MTLLTVTAKGQVTLRKELLEHLGVAPGDKISVDSMPDGSITIRGTKKGKISDLFGYFKNENGPHLTLEEISEAISRGWAGKR